MSDWETTTFSFNQSMPESLENSSDVKRSSMNITGLAGAWGSSASAQCDAENLQTKSCDFKTYHLDQMMNVTNVLLLCFQHTIH